MGFLLLSSKLVDKAAEIEDDLDTKPTGYTIFSLLIHTRPNAKL